MWDPFGDGLVGVLRGHTSVVSQLAWTTVGRTPYLLTGGWDGRVLFWDTSALGVAGIKPKLVVAFDDHAPIWYLTVLGPLMVTLTKAGAAVHAHFRRLPDLVRA